MKTQSKKSILTPVILMVVIIVSAIYITKTSVESYRYFKNLEANGQIFTCMIDMIQ